MVADRSQGRLGGASRHRGGGGAAPRLHLPHPGAGRERRAVLLGAAAGLLAPAGTPPETGEAIALVIRSALEAEAGQVALTRVGALPRPMTPAQFRVFLAGEVAHWAEAVRLTGATVE